MFDLSNKICLVTGATRGIGKAIAAQLGAQGATVIGTATSQAGAETISSALKDASIQGEGVVLNVANGDSVEAVLKHVTDTYGAINVLVNNAGITRDNLMMRMKEEEWDDIMSTNLKSVYRLSKGVLRGMMKARTGRIINITSVVGVSGNAGQANYAAAKAGVIGFSKSLAQEIASRGITVNAIAPGFINTDMTKALNEEQVSKMTANIPAARLGEPEDIAASVVFLASDESSYITGATLHVNGGMYMT
ncbi:3-oxoacyl-[acyl-carrier-protein] reductase FabG [Arenicella chitinivorans]|uniref:3-oxoacyl-[acyl-carrier-protein] reductase n=1 Tax=Arenicella chitinivorans TaxID=1329800 RepID=A0A918VP92_9GAMM|nr:3-oxoacyl-ACP reductase FabG [Arenicella chitinivorans]GHA16794.1 3-oxoacyl-[acyl-carrier-protein] reductase FabG [Arenicella chitinivorans]